MKAIILVAGYATRLYPLTLTTPKPLLTIGGRPIIDYIVDKIYEIDEIDEIFVVSNHKFAAQFEKWAKTARSEKRITVIDDGSTNEDNRLGAIGDIIFTIDKQAINEDLMVIAGDNYFTYSLKAYYDYFRKINADCVCVKRIDDVEMLKSFGVACVDENSKVTHLEEKPAKPKSDLAVFATYIYKKETLPMFKQYMAEGNQPDAPGYFTSWLYKQKDLFAYEFDGECYDIGTPKALEDAQKLFD